MFDPRHHTRFLLCILGFASAASATSYLNVTSTAPTVTASSDTSTDVGAIILQGLGASSTTTGLGTGLPYSVAASETDQPDHVSFTTTLTNLSSNTQSMTEALTCWSEFMTWKSASIDFKNSVIANKTWPVTSSTTVTTYPYEWATTLYPANVSTYKLCDGSPRVNIRPATTRYTTITTETDTFTDLATPTYSIPQPCVPSVDDCMLLYEQTNLTWDNADLNGQCGFPAHLMQHGEAPCIFAASGAVQLFYFPVETANGSLCAPSRSTITPLATTTGPNVVTVDGQEFTSGSAYISLQSLYVYFDGFFNVTLGPTFTNLLLTMQSTDISTQCSGMTNMTQLNYGDLNWPVPASAYACQDRCWYQSEVTRMSGFPGYEPFPSQCATIWEDVNPDLAIPTKVLKSMVPEWSNCVAGDGNQPNFWFDPPKKLTQVSIEASVTVPSAPKTTPAAPSSPPPTALPESTIGPASPPMTTSVASTTSPQAQPTSEDGRSTPTLQPSDAPSSDDSQASHGETSDPSPTPHTSQPADPTAVGISDPADPASAANAAQPADPSSRPSDPTAGGPSDASSSGVSNPTVADPTAAPQSQATAAAVSILAAALPTSADSPTNAASGAVSDDASGQSSSSPLADPAESADPRVPDTQTLSPVASVQGSESVGSGNTVLAAGSLTVTASALPSETSAAVVAGSTISQGGAGLTIGNQVVSQGSSGLVVHAAAADPSLLTADGLTVTASQLSGSSGVISVAGTTLSVGGPAAAIASGQTVSLDSSGLVMVGAESTQAFSGVQDPAGWLADSKTTLAVGSLTMTVTSASGVPHAVSVAGTIISVGGGPVAVDGQTLSEASNGLVVISSRTTMPVSDIAAASGDLSGSATLPGVTIAQQTSSGASLSSESSVSPTGGAQPATASGAGHGRCPRALWHSIAFLGWSMALFAYYM